MANQKGDYWLDTGSGAAHQTTPQVALKAWYTAGGRSSNAKILYVDLSTNADGSVLKALTTH